MISNNQISYDQYFKQPRIYKGHGLTGLKFNSNDNSEKFQIKTWRICFDKLFLELSNKNKLYNKKLACNIWNGIIRGLITITNYGKEVYK